MATLRKTLQYRSKGLIMHSTHQHTNEKMFVLITGSAGGLGKAFAVECASRGWDLFITDQFSEPLEILATTLRSAYEVNLTTHACDLTSEADRGMLIKRIYNEALRFTALINVAGVDFEGAFLDQDIHQIETIIRLNIEASAAMIHAILRVRKPGARFYIINVASLAAFYPMPIKATYAASKRFLLDFSIALREELRAQNVNVTALCPAGMPTTPGTIRAINAQGLAGFMTTIDACRVANQTLNSVLAGRAIVIPGWINRMIRDVSLLIPPVILARLIYGRWSSRRLKIVSGKVGLEKSYSSNR
jgi:short-subunit dehydrogenase